MFHGPLPPLPGILPPNFLLQLRCRLLLLVPQRGRPAREEEAKREGETEREEGWGEQREMAAPSRSLQPLALARNGHQWSLGCLRLCQRPSRPHRPARLAAAERYGGPSLALVSRARRILRAHVYCARRKERRGKYFNLLKPVEYNSWPTVTGFHSGARS